MVQHEVASQNGDVSIGEKRPASVLGSKSPSPPDPALISVETFSAAEQAVEQVLNWVHPTLDSEEKRRDVIDYVQQLVKSRLNCEAVSYGSVPLKTYLPDGDIDLTILKGPNAEDSLANDVLSLLEDEEQNQDAEYQINDTQFIDAEVKLVKCIVQNIVVDVTFNQLGGLSTLCFLEQVDRLVGRNHLFKRSIILIKTWCYYESRILGSHHGLISTYALETLVLYIFHFFHSSLSGPLAVLYRFLDYYSKFDWENYCISLKGPVHKLSLPDFVVVMPDNGYNHLLLSEEFLENCMEMFSVPSKGPEAIPKAFQPKHLNIIDPLKENNNLGRSVHRGNFYRIRSAFKYGAHKLGQVLLRARDVGDETLNFFSNTRARHEHQHTRSTRHLALDFSDQDSLTASLSSPVEFLSDDDMLLKSSASDFDNDSIRLEQAHILESGGEQDGYSIREVSNSGASFSENHFHKLHSFTSKSFAGNGSSDDQQTDSVDSEKFDFNLWLKNREEHMEPSITFRSCMDNCNCRTGSDSATKGDVLESSYLDFTEIDSNSVAGESEAFNPLADLTGDYDCNIRSLLSAQLCHGFASSASHAVLNPPSSSPPRIQNKKPCDTFHQSISHKDYEFPHTDINITPIDNSMGSVSDSAFLGSAIHFEGPQKTRGIGTYFPHVNACYMERSSHWRGRNNLQGNHNLLHKYHNNSFYSTGESNSFENGTHEVVPTRRRYQGRRRSDVQVQFPSTARGGNQINGFIGSSCRIEFGSIGNLAEEVISGSDGGRCSALGTSLKAQDSTVMMMRDRVAGQSIHLKNDDEFPPLCL